MLKVLVNFVKSEIALPALRRISSNAATGLTVAGVSAGDVETLTAAGIILVGIVVDLVFSRRNSLSQRSKFGQN